MTLPEFLLRRNERRSTWLFNRAWVPARTERYSWLRVAAFTGVCAAIVALVVSGFLWAVFGGFGGAQAVGRARQMLPWIAAFAAEFGGCIGLSWSLLSRVCWNHRAAQLGTAPETPAGESLWPKRRPAVRFISALLYTLLICLFTPLVLFHTIENLRGAWAWRQMRAELKAKGECYELPCIIPAPARDEENFFATPFWTQFAYVQVKGENGRVTNKWLQGSPFDYITNFALPSEPNAVTRTKGLDKKDPTDGRTDLAAWAAQFRWVTTNTGKVKYNGPHLEFPLAATPGKPAEDVLLALSKFESTLAEFAAAAPRPRSVYPTHYEEGFNALLPNLAALRSSAQICQLRAVARLNAGNSAGAASDTLLAFRIGESLSEDPLLISQLVRFGADALAMRALWEGLVDHRWSEAQLAEFQSVLARRDYASGIVRALEGERVLGNLAVESLLRGRMRGLMELDRVTSDNAGYSDTGMSLAFFMPSGWFRQNQIGLLRGYQQILENVRTRMNRTNRTVALNRAGEHDDATDEPMASIKGDPSPFSLFAKMLLPAITQATAKADRAQAMAGMAVVACALERYHLAHGDFPAALADLVPTYLTAVPTDWMGGQPLHYERSNKELFRLWSIGPNGKDDGGVLREPIGRNWGEALDWPWPQPVMSKEPRLF